MTGAGRGRARQNCKTSLSVCLADCWLLTGTNCFCFPFHSSKHLFEVPLSPVKPKKNKISQVKKSGRNPYKTQTAFSSFKYANGIDNSNKVKQYQSHKTEKSTKFRSSKQFKPIFFRGSKPGAATIKRTESPVKNIVRKKLKLTEKPRGPNVMSTLEKILKKHFSIFSYF